MLMDRTVFLNFASVPFIGGKNGKCDNYWKNNETAE